MSRAKRKDLTGRGAVGKAAVVGAKDRVTARTARGTVTATLQGFVRETAKLGASVFTDEAAAYRGMGGFRHEAVNHSAGEYVQRQAHTNSIESFWAMLKRGYQGTFHHFSEKYLDRYVLEYIGRQNDREADTIDQMKHMATRKIGNHLRYQESIAG